MAVKFRRGGRLAASDKVFCNKKPLEFVNSFKYLALRMHFTGTLFTGHLQDRIQAALSSIYVQVKDVRKLSVQTAIRLYGIKIVPMLSYSLDRVWNHLTYANFGLLEKVFCVFMKRVLCLHSASRSRFIYVLGGCGPSIEEIRIRLKVPPTDAFNQFLSDWQQKVVVAMRQVRTLDVFHTKEMWEGTSCGDRHVYTRYMVHGYHHLICEKTFFHEVDAECRCRYCLETCDIYHVTKCEAKAMSLHAWARYVF